MKQSQLVIKVVIDFGDIKEDLDITADVADMTKAEITSLTTSMLNTVGKSVMLRFRDKLYGIDDTKELTDIIEEIQNERKKSH